ncbi:hypothetical protein [Pedococcus sp.]|uniref:hypothetical protein n=1 Tax=Pedococcus sp. TaxID=2860345 RepID=UPI002E0F1739|nr:hypothetical protein [Pedococcus sp.]
MPHALAAPSRAGACGVSLGTAAGLLALGIPAGAAAFSTYHQVNLVSDVPGVAQVTDPNLVNT